MASYYTIRKRCKWIRWIAVIVCFVLVVRQGILHGLVNPRQSGVSEAAPVIVEGTEYQMLVYTASCGEPTAWTGFKFELYPWTSGYYSSPPNTSVALTAETRTGEFEYIFRRADGSLTEPQALKVSSTHLNSIAKSMQSRGIDVRVHEIGREWSLVNSILSFLRSSILPALFAGLFLMFVFALTWPRKAGRRYALTCLQCGYDLHGLKVNRCPECGHRW